MYFPKKKRIVPHYSLRSRLEGYSSKKEKAGFYGPEGEEKLSPSLFNIFPFSALKEMHSLLLFKVTLVFALVLVIFFISLVNFPFSASFMERVKDVTTWRMDFLEMGRGAAPVLRSLWEGNLEHRLEREVLAPVGENTFEEGQAPSFLIPLEGEPEVPFGFGFNTVRQKEEISYGLVLAAPTRGEVKASAGGEVKELGENSYYGKYIVLKHAGGMESCYGYLEEALVRPGDEVQQGQVIAHTGSFSHDGATALYFEIRERGRPLDPLPLLMDW